MIGVLCAPSLAAAADPYPAGFRFLSAKSGADTVPIALTYPATGKETARQFGPFTLKVAMDARPAKGRYGVILLSHGAGGGNLNHRTTALALARAGWIVAAVEHPGGNWRDGSRTGTQADFEGRPRHLRAALDLILADPVLSKVVDPKRIGAIGYSMGGYAVLASVGGKPDVQRLVKHCTENSKKDPRFCGYRKAAGVLNSLTVVPDRRIRAALVVAPVAAIFGPGAFKGVTAKIRVYRAGKDEELAHPFHAAHLQGLLPIGSEYRTVEGIGHFTFIAPFPPAIRAQAGRVAQDPPGIDRAAVHRALNAEILAFFAKALPRR